jgi:predicted site-specific integrase-resolvase
MTTKEAMELIGCKSRRTLYNYREKGVLRSGKSPRGHLYWFDEDVYALIGKRINKGERKIVAYFRVSQRRYKKELQDQIARVKKFCQSSGISVDDTYADYGKGTDYSTKGRPEFHRLLEDLFKKKISTIIVDHKSRLTTFQWGIIETLCRYHGVEVQVINQIWEDDHYLKEVRDDLTELLVQLKVGSLAELADKTGEYDKGWDDVVDMKHRPLDDDED